MAGGYQALEQHVIVYNPLAWNLTTIINMTVTFPTASVFDDNGQPVPAQVKWCVFFVCSETYSVCFNCTDPPLLQIQRSAYSNTTYDLFIMVELGGLQHRKYMIKLSEKRCSGRKCGWTYEAKGVLFKRRNVRESLRTGRRLLPVLNDCYKLMFDQDTNLLHSITYL